MSRILIIDDEADVRDLYRNMLEDQEYDIAEAENGQEALALAREEVFDLFITDIMMPKMTGLDFIGKLRGIDANALVVIITGFDDISYNRKAIECGAWRYLVKPVSRKELLGVARLGVQERSRLPYPEGLERHEHTRAPQQEQPALEEQPPVPEPEPAEWMGETALVTVPQARMLSELFDDQARDMLRLLREEHNEEVLQTQAGFFEERLERPFRTLFSYIAQQLPVSLAQSLDTSTECFEPVLQRKPQGLIVHDYLVGAVCKYGQQREESGQLFIALNQDMLQYGFTIGEYGDESQLRFISHVHENIDDLRPLILMLAETMAFGPMLVRLFELEREPVPLITAEGDNLASLHVVAGIPVAQFANITLEELRSRIIHDFSNLYPLILLATEDHPLASIMAYLGLAVSEDTGEHTPEPAYAPLPDDEPYPADTPQTFEPDDDEEPEPTLQPRNSEPEQVFRRAEPPYRAEQTFVPREPQEQPAAGAQQSVASQPAMPVWQMPVVTPAAHAEVAYKPAHSADGVEVETREQWVRALRRRHQVLLLGPAGCGKTRLARDLARSLVNREGDGFWEVVSLHADMTAGDLLGSRNDDGEELPGLLPLLCREAAEYVGACALVLDGLEHLEAGDVPGVLLSVLSQRGQQVIYRGLRFLMPPNLYIIGTYSLPATPADSLMRVFPVFRVDYDFSELIDLLPGNLAEVLMPVLEELLSVLPEIGLEPFLVDDLWEELPEIWISEVEPLLEKKLVDQSELLERLRWRSLARGVLSVWNIVDEQNGNLADEPPEDEE